MREILTKPFNNDIIDRILNQIGPLNYTKGPWIAGGNARRFWFNEPWHNYDIDLFFANNESCFNAAHSLKKLSSVFGNDLTIVSADNTYYKSSNAITYKIYLKKETNASIKIQVINRQYYQSAEEIWNDFDFTVCNFAYDGKTLYADKKAVEHCEQKILVQNESTSRSIMPIRVLKYSLYGFNASSDIMKELVKLKENDEFIDDWYNDGY